MSHTFFGKKFFDVFPPPEYLLLSMCGIVVTNAHIKYAELKHNAFGKGFQPVHFGKKRHQEGTIEQGVIKNIASLSQSLKEISSEYGISYARATLPDEKSYIFTAVIDSVADRDLPDAAAFIIEEHVPVSLAESVFDFEVVGRNPAEGKIKIAVSVVPKNIVESYTAAFEAAGITIISFDIESQAVARAAVSRGDSRAHLVIKISGNKSAFYVVEDEVVQFSSIYAHGVNSGVEGVRSEMKKVLDFWNDRVPLMGDESSRVERVLVCGAGSSNAEFVANLFEGLDIEHSTVDVWRHLPHARRQMKPDEETNYAAAIGLVLPHEIRRHV